jgi:pyruvate dehydrogenase E2 component (dihydrolipoamide acetyltransferase)
MKLHLKNRHLFKQSAPNRRHLKPQNKRNPTNGSTSSGATTVVVQVPDIGVEKATVAELLVKVGDQISENDSLILLESDKASVEVPSPVSGTVESVAVKEGDSVKEGVVLLKVKTQAASEETTEQTATANENTVAQPAETTSTNVEDETDTQETVSSGEQEISVPDLGVDKATVSEILVQVGDHVDAQQSLCVVESDKASVEVPAVSRVWSKRFMSVLDKRLNRALRWQRLKVKQNQRLKPKRKLLHKRVQSKPKVLQNLPNNQRLLRLIRQAS